MNADSRSKLQNVRARHQCDAKTLPHQRDDRIFVRALHDNVRLDVVFRIERAGARPHPGVLIVSNYRIPVQLRKWNSLPFRQRMILRCDDNKLLVRHRKKFHVILFQTAAKAYI